MSYWQKRQERLNMAAEKDEESLKKRLTSYYASEEEKLNRQIASYYANYGKDNVIEYRRLLEKLPAADRELLMRDMEGFADKFPEYKHLLPVRESVYKLNRLEGLQYSVQLQQLEIGAKEQQEVEKHLTKLSERSFDSVRDDIGAGNIFNSERADVIKTVVGVDWTSTGSFSERIWKNRQKLAHMLSNDIAAGFARGDSYASLTKQIQSRFNVGKKEASRLIYTEGTFVMNESRAKAFEGTFDYYSISTVGDGKVCDICRTVQDKTQARPVKFADRIAGVNFPPFHPWCRCMEQIVVPDPQRWINDYVEKYGGDPDISEGQRRKAKEMLTKFGSFSLKNNNTNDIIKLKDTAIHKSVGAKAKNYDILDPDTGDVYRFVEGTRIQDSEVFAGAGTKHPLHAGVPEGLTEQFGGSVSKWKHCKGHGTVDFHGEERPAEVHWFQEETVGKVRFKIKRWEHED